MTITSRRVRTEEKKLIKKVLITISGIIGLMLFLLYIGLPALGKILLYGVKDAPTSTQASQTLFPPVFDPLPEATNSALIHISGYAQEGASLHLVVNDEETDETSINKEGTFLIKAVKLKEGNNTIIGYIKKGKEQSGASANIQIVYKKGDPNIDISFPSDGQSFSSDQKTITIKGTTDAENRVTVNDRLAIIDHRGSFSLSYSLQDGENKLNIISQDPAGNQVKKEITVSYHP